MDFNRTNKCHECDKMFASKNSLSRHRRTIHSITSLKTNIKCPICINKDEFYRSYQHLNTHLTENHNINIEIATFTFTDTQIFEEWMGNEQRDINYRLRNQHTSATNRIHYYECTRSNSRNYSSIAKERKTKLGGSIKINGFCPSRIIAKHFANDFVEVTHVKTHVGHEIEPGKQRLTKEEKSNILQKLEAGVTVDRIIQDGRNMDNGIIERINLLTRQDVFNVARSTKKTGDDLTQIELKVNQWNSTNKNYAFFYKPKGTQHDVLKVEDFALGFMNSIMEAKLLNCRNIICMDGTHGTNRRSWDLTIILVKDDTNAGFPVAFLVSNRQDQLIQELFLDALRRKVGNLDAVYFMSDDDPKYFNAWTKIMCKEPQRLLCTWHVIKNWNIQGRNKIKDMIMKKTMKKEMKRILNTTDIATFENLRDKYLENLEKAEETDFSAYLKKYYFQSQQRERMWAHCYRLNAGINTNMAIESLNRYLKYNKLNGSTNVTLIKLMDSLEEIVNEKMWTRIIKLYRPSTNSYQERLVSKAHIAAVKMGKDILQKVGSGHFQVKSSNGDDYYNVKFNVNCGNGCQNMFCDICQVCIHQYKCDCFQYAVRNTLCKHIHLVKLHEEKEALSFSDAENSHGQLQQSQLVNEICNFVQHQVSFENQETTVTEKKEIIKERLNGILNTIEDEESMDHLWEIFNQMVSKFEGKTTRTSLKRKLDKQTYFSQTKRRN